VSERPDGEADYKIFIELKDPAMASAADGKPKFYSEPQMEDCRGQVEAAREELRECKAKAQTAIEAGIARQMQQMRFPYRFEAGKKPFRVRAIYHDDRFTYLHARPEEPPVLYEIQDGKPGLVNFQYKDGVYVADKVIERGYLTIGKQKLSFFKEE
jgi:type IV secretion system protein VirB9